MRYKYCTVQYKYCTPGMEYTHVSGALMFASVRLQRSVTKRFPSCITFVSRNVTDSLDHSAVNLIIGWNEFNSVEKTYKLSSDDKNVFYIPPPNGQFLPRLMLKVTFKFAHKDICVGWGHSGSHPSSFFLQIMQTIEGKIILLHNNWCQLDNILGWRIQDLLFIQCLPTCV